jgi:hypothetical protein
METYWGSWGILPRILNLDARWRWVVSFTPRPLYLRCKIPPRHPFDRRLGGPQSWFGRGGKIISRYWSYRELKTCRPARSLVFILPDCNFKYIVCVFNYVVTRFYFESNALSNIHHPVFVTTTFLPKNLLIPLPLFWVSLNDTVTKRSYISRRYNPFRYSVFRSEARRSLYSIVSGCKTP